MRRSLPQDGRLINAYEFSRPAVTIDGVSNNQKVMTMMQGEWMGGWGAGYMGGWGGLWMVLVVVLIIVGIVAVIRKK